MKLRTFRYFFREAWRGIVRNRLMSLTAMGTIAIALILFGVFSLFTTNLQYFSGLALGRIEIRAFLRRVPAILNWKAESRDPRVQSVSLSPRGSRPARESLG